MRRQHRTRLADSLHAARLPVGAEVFVLIPGASERVRVTPRWDGGRRLAQPLTVTDDGLPGWVDRDQPYELSATWDGGERAHATRRLRSSRRSPRPVPAAGALPATAVLREMRSVPAAATASIATPDSVEITIEGTDYDVTVQSPISPITFRLDERYGPTTAVTYDHGFGVDSAGNAYWDPAGADPGDEASLFLNPLTLELSLERKD